MTLAGLAKVSTIQACLCAHDAMEPAKLQAWRSDGSLEVTVPETLAVTQEPILLKSKLINAIAAKNGYSSYLEISTPTTGQQFKLIDRNILPTCELAVYYLQNDDVDDHLADFKTGENTSRELLKLLPESKTFDLIFVDPFHTYDNSMEDLVAAFALVKPGGALVVHDCNPEDESIVSPHFKEGAWCGVTYWAYIDFVLGNIGMNYFTVDTDYGCGVIMKEAAERPPSRSELYADWLIASGDDKPRYEFFNLKRRELLNLITVEQFSSMMGLAAVQEPTDHSVGGASNSWPWNQDDTWL